MEVMGIMDMVELEGDMDLSDKKHTFFPGHGHTTVHLLLLVLVIIFIYKIKLHHETNIVNISSFNQKYHEVEYVKHHIYVLQQYTKNLLFSIVVPKVK